MKGLFRLKVLLLFFLFVCRTFPLFAQVGYVWGRQFGTEKEEYSMNHNIDSLGFIYFSGKTEGSFKENNFGGNDGFVVKLDSAGNIIWKDQFGSEGEEDILWSSADKEGNIYITGSTNGAMNSKNFGKEDIFVIKYSSVGKKIWTRQFGTDSTDIGSGIYTDNKGSVYVTGQTSGLLGQESFGKSDLFLMKLDQSGKILFVRQFGTAGDDFSNAVTGAGPFIYLCGSTWGDLGGKNMGMIDAFAGKFTTEGMLVKFSQIGTSGFDIAMQIITDNDGNFYIGGSTSGNLAGDQRGEGDCFLSKFDNKGNVLWNRQFGTKNHDGIRGLAINKRVSDGIFVSGLLNLPPAQAFVSIFSKEGEKLWEKIYPDKDVVGDASGKNVTVDDLGNVYFLGLTGASIFDKLKGGHDVFLVRMKLENHFMKN